MFTFSEEHRIYLKSLKREKRIISFWQICLILLFLILWEVLARMSILNPFLYSSPSRIFHTFLTLFQSGELFQHIGITVYEVFVSFLFATILGLFFSFILWRYERVSKIMDPYITVLNSLPKVALGPLIIIWVGTSMNSIIFMALTISLFTTIINIYTGFCSVPKNYLIMVQSFGASKLQIFFKVILPSNLENIIATLKINVSMSLIGVIMGELLVSKSGLGYLIMYGSQVFQLDLVISSIFILGILSYLMYFMIDRILILVQKKRS